MNIKKHIPNAITSLNLVSGCIAIILTFNFDLKYAAYFILLAAVFDFFDGMAARWLHVKSAIGKELDSLADVVSFGVAPGLIVFQLCAVSNDIVLFAGEINLIPFIALLIPVFFGAEACQIQPRRPSDGIVYRLTRSGQCSNDCFPAFNFKPD